MEYTLNIVFFVIFQKYHLNYLTLIIDQGMKRLFWWFTLYVSPVSNILVFYISYYGLYYM